MLKFIDISCWQHGIGLPQVMQSADGCICKATEGTGYVSDCCDTAIETLKKLDKVWGFYHFARHAAPEAEADFFIANTKNYFGHGVPVLDWEDGQSADWVNDFVRRVHDVTGVWCWIYANPSRFAPAPVEPNCMRWVAAYPAVDSPSFDWAAQRKPPKADGTVGAWQFCSDGRLPGHVGNLDLNLFYGDRAGWERYAAGDSRTDEKPQPQPQPDESKGNVKTYRVTVEEV